MNVDSSVVDKLEPVGVFQCFSAIAAIPRGSGCEARIGDYLMDFAASRGLEAYRDSVGNVLIRKPGLGAGAAAKGIIMQSHMDMVQITEDGAEVDMSRDGVKLVVDGDALRASGTTLGADNGIGMAYSLAMLEEKEMDHPPIEALFTVDEETGMTGAIEFDVSRLKGEYLINMDSEEDGIFYVSCAGGLRMRVALPLERREFSVLGDHAALSVYEIVVDGLRGGHSGIEIHKQLGNANQLLGRVLHDLSLDHDFHLADIEGGIVDNAIPVSASAAVVLNRNEERSVARRLAELQEVFRKELEAADGAPDVSGKAFEVVVAMRQVGAAPSVLTRKSRDEVIALCNLLPHGVAAMDLHLAETLVETSSNFALIRCKDDACVFNVSIRSAVASKKEALSRRIELLAAAFGATADRRSSYPSWQFNPESRLRPLFQEAYRKLRGSEAVVKGIHAGLECGVFDDAFRAAGRKLDIISLGPDITGAHSPDEKVDIPSVGRTWELIREAVTMLCGTA